MMDAFKSERPEKRGPYKRHLYFPDSPLPRTTRQRNERTAHAGDQLMCVIGISEEIHTDRVSEPLLDSFQTLADDSDESPQDTSELVEDDGGADPLSDITEDIGCDTSEDTIEHNEAEMLYPGARLTLATSMLLVMTFVMRHNLTMEALCDLLTLLELHCLSGNIFITSIKTFRQFFRNLKAPLEFHYYCDFCSNYHGSTKPEKCPVCDNQQQDHSFFILLPLVSQLESIVRLNLPEINKYRTKILDDTYALRDAMSGLLYRELFDGHHFQGTAADQRKNEIHISLQMNTDGVSVFKSSKFSIWPVYFTINELSPEMRYTRECRLFGGLWFGKSKPDMKIFIRPFVQQLNSLFRQGFELTTSLGMKTVKAALISAVFDAPARCSVQDFIQFNGFYGCATCYSEGETVSAGNGSTRVYPFDTSESCKASGHAAVRTHEETLSYAKQAAQTGKTVKGVKGISWLLRIPMFDIIRGVTIDYMHCVLLGVTKMMINLWLSPTHRHENWYIGKKVAEIDRRLAALRPPNCISRLPKPISDLAHWKASEIRSFLLFYAVPTLYGILPEDHYSHFLCLVQGIQILLCSKISISDLEKARQLLYKFCLMFDCMYSKRYESSNVHALLHLHEKVRDLGPLWAHSCFFFEDLNGDLRKLFHGTQKVELQIINFVSIKQKLPELAHYLQPFETGAARLYDTMTSHYKVTKATEFITEGVSAVENIVKCSVSAPLKNTILQMFGTVSNFCKFERLLFHGQVLHSKMYTAVRQRNSYTIEYFDVTGNVVYGMVKYYLRCDCVNGQKLYLAAVDQLDLVECVMKVPCHMRWVAESNSVAIISVDKIVSLCIYMKTPGQENGLVASFPNRFERD